VELKFISFSRDIIHCCTASSGRWGKNLLVPVKLKRLLYRVKIHKHLLTSHIFIGPSCIFFLVLDFISVRHPAIFFYRCAHFPLWKKGREEDKISQDLYNTDPFQSTSFNVKIGI
jgi:hypothetical protein